MKKVIKIALGIFAFITILMAGLLGYVKTMLPDVGPAPEMKVELTAARIERGAYLANHVVVCMDCHSKRDWSLYSGPLVENTNGMGGELFDQKFGFPGAFTSKNITPAGVGTWTDGELYRAITCGVSKDGHALFPVMPWKYYGQLDPEDIMSVIAYVRTLAPIENTPAPSEADFPVNFILNTLPVKQEPMKRPSPENELEYGKYVTTAAGCAECHTKQEKGEMVGELFAGGFEFNMPNNTVITSANITPHETGIAAWSKEAFIRRFKMYQDSGYVVPKVNMEAQEMQTVMPWTMYSGMTEQDLGAIYTYLRSVAPVENKIEKFVRKN